MAPAASALALNPAAAPDVPDAYADVADTPESQAGKADDAAAERSAATAAAPSSSGGTAARSHGGYDKYRINLTREEAPAHVVYPYVLRGYRAGGDYKRCLRAAFELHTETFNAWTMVAGALVSAGLFAWVAAALWRQPVALVPFAALSSAVWLHMPFSVGFHLFRGISADVYNLWRRLDQAFIFIVSVLITLGLSWHVYPRWAWVALNTGLSAAIAVVGVREIRGLQPHFQRHRGQMVVFIGSAVLCYWAPMGVEAVRELVSRRGVPGPAAGLAVATFAVLQLGGWVFAAGFPERFWPGVFDMCGFSHQLMHVAVVVAHVLEYAFVWHLRGRGAPH